MTFYSVGGNPVFRKKGMVKITNLSIKAWHENYKFLLPYIVNDEINLRKGKSFYILRVKNNIFSCFYNANNHI